MAQYVNLAAAPDRALTAVLLDNTQAVVATASSVDEVSIATVTNKTGVYRATFSTTNLTGGYRLVVVDDLTAFGIASYEAHFSGINGETINASEYHASGSADEKLTQILAKITPITTIYAPQPQSESISLIRGDAYDGTANAKLAWTATKDVDGQTVNFTIRDSKDAIILDQSTTGVTTSATGTLVEVALTTAATELLDPAVSIYKFDVEIEFSADSRWTITKGNVCVEGDESR